jgi:tetratricopeptide (TPR) repeat protein
MELGFNLDHDEAVAAFKESIAADPDNLAGYRLLAGALWSHALFQQGAITTDDFVGENASAYRKRASDPELERTARELMRRAEALSAAIRDGSTTSVDARYEVGAAYRFLSTLEGTIGGSQWRSLGAARQAYREHHRVLLIAPQRADAALTVGLYRYLVSTMPAWSRLVALVAGLDSDRRAGIRLVEHSAATEGEMQASALFSLIVIYNQQQRYDEAIATIHRLQVRFPRNRLLWLEAACTELRAGRAAAARASIEHGLAMLDSDPRPRAYGELARWHYHYGIALARLNQIEPAEQQLGAALRGEALEWVRRAARAELTTLARQRR